MTTRQKRPQRPVRDSQPLTPKEERAVERQGATLAWAREVHERTTGEPPDGLWTRGVCGGSEAR